MAASISKYLVKQLSVSYGSKAVLSEVSFSLCLNAITSVVGPSGCGKSTLLLVLAGLLEDTPSVHVRGAIEGFEREHLGIVFQKPLPFRLSIYENVALALREITTSEMDIRLRVEEALTDAGLWPEVRDRLNESALKLSGGQQQRLCLARTLALRPSVLLLDEPCSSLDPISTQGIEQTLLRLSSKTTVLIVTHNLSQARRLSQNVMVLWDTGFGGTIVEKGGAQDIFINPKIEIVRQYLNGFLG
ncbi:MAG: ATP-binding cassette domain-containing protein [Bdellovibrionales bacterium]|nr:ATP-binding cassette domain-containing protein [Bdellovibrionales bacterium]